MRDFKIQCTPLQSKLIQEILKISLPRGGWKCQNHYLYYEDEELFVGFSKKDFEEDYLTEITFPQFLRIFDDQIIIIE